MKCVISWLCYRNFNPVPMSTLEKVRLFIYNSIVACLKTLSNICCWYSTWPIGRACTMTYCLHQKAKAGGPGIDHTMQVQQLVINLIHPVAIHTSHAVHEQKVIWSFVQPSPSKWAKPCCTNHRLCNHRADFSVPHLFPFRNQRDGGGSGTVG